MKQKNNPAEELAAIMNQLADSVLEIPDSQTSTETSDAGIDSTAEAEHTRNILREASNRYATNGPAKAIPPSLGERAAMTGYHAQYRVAASLILPLLATEELYAIRIADPAAGRVDDLVTKLKARGRAHRMKWDPYGRVLEV